jgi:hypothetical protein
MMRARAGEAAMPVHILDVLAAAWMIAWRVIERQPAYEADAGFRR